MRAFRDANVLHPASLRNLLMRLTGPAPDDWHVLAAAVVSGCEVIFMLNLRDFPADVLAGVGVAALRPDEFVTELMD